MLLKENSLGGIAHGACDTDVQTLGKADVLAHTSLMGGMYTI